MLRFLHKYGFNLHSQNLEDGVLAECLHRLGFVGKQDLNATTIDPSLRNGYAVEVGGNDGAWMSNIRRLLELGWSGLYVEADYSLHLRCEENWRHDPSVRCQCSCVDGRNINAFVDERCDLVSLDTDGHDYEIFCGMKARPKIVIVEIDSSIEPPSERVNSDGGVGYWTMTVAALERGYFVICHSGNLILCRQDYGHLFPECELHPLLEWELYFNRSWL